MARLKSEIHFGLVNIPVTYQTVIKNNDISFHQLHKKCFHRIRYQKVCPQCKVIVHESDLIKGYEYTKDEYVTFTKPELQQLKIEEEGIEIVSFVSKKEIDSYFLEKTYTLLPPKKSQSYSLFVEMLKKSKKVALAKTTIGNKFYYVILEFLDTYLLMTTLYFLEEIELPNKLEEVRFTKKEVELADLLIKQLSGHFEPEKYQDDYQQRIKEAIEKKMSGDKISKRKKKSRKSVKDLVTALQESLEVKK